MPQCVTRAITPGKAAIVAELTEAGTSRYVQLKDWRVHYNEAGEGHPLILLHGSGAGASGWVNFRHNIPGLAEHFKVYAIDGPGWGKSEAVTWEGLDHVEMVKQFMDELGIEKAALVGNSMGGVTSLGFVTKYPERVSHLITMGSGSSRTPKLFIPGGGLSEGLKVLFDCYFDNSIENQRRLCSIMTFNLGDKLEPFAIERLESAALNPEHLTNMVAGLPHGSPVPKWFSIDDLLNVKTPSLLIHGRDDRVVHYENSLLLLAYLQNSRLVLFNQCGHWAMIEYPEEFNRLVIDFVKNN